MEHLCKVSLLNILMLTENVNLRKGNEHLKYYLEPPDCTGCADKGK